MQRYLYLICFVLTLGLSLGLGAVPVKTVRPKLVVRNDSTVITEVHFNKAALKNYSLQKEFQYDDTYAGESLWSRFWHWFWSLFSIERQHSFAGILVTIIGYIFIGLGIAAIIFLIMKLAGVDALNIIKRKPASMSIPYEEGFENIYAINFDDEIEKAITQKNYRLAVRLKYLKCLKQLSDAGLIKWDINKTNSAYINELTDAEQRLAFNLLTRQFEYVWYGEFIIDAPVFTRINTMFNDFKVRVG